MGTPRGPPADAGRRRRPYPPPGSTAPLPESSPAHLEPASARPCRLDVAGDRRPRAGARPDRRRGRQRDLQPDQRLVVGIRQRRHRPRAGLDQRPDRGAASRAAATSVAAVAQELLPSTVQIFAEYDGQEGGATGSGFVIDGEGHVITNNHVVEQAAEDDGPIEIVDQDGNRYEADGRRPLAGLRPRGPLQRRGARR